MEENSLHTLLQKSTDQYYKGEPTLFTDAEYDYLCKKTGFRNLGTLSQKDKVLFHAYRMYSLKKVFKGEDEPPFEADLSKTCQTLKYDGTAISLLYVNGVLSLALLRGNHVKGEDISDNILAWDKIPKTIPQMGRVQLNVEIVAPKNIPNARNYAAGALRLKAAEDFLSRSIFPIVHGVYPYLTDFYDGDMEIVRSWGFQTACENDYLYEDFPNDGWVIRLNSNAEYEAAGFTAEYPKGAYALKDPADVPIVETELLDVVWQVGKGGKITPVAIFSEIDIEGAKINRATLHNVGFIEEMGLEIGDIILVTRSGGIIPKVLGKL